MNIQRIAERSKDRVAERIGNNPTCPWCERELAVRRTVIGLRPLIDGVQMKCAGEEGCGFRPDFDIPITRDEYDEEMELRDGVRAVDVVYDADEDGERDIESQLAALGYIEGDMTNVD